MGLEVRKCPCCSKRFIPAPLHVYKTKNGRVVCSYSCSRNAVKKKVHITSTQTKKVAQYSPDGEFITEYPSVSEAAKTVGTQPNRISRVCLQIGNSKHAAGYKWKFVEA